MAKKGQKIGEQTICFAAPPYLIGHGAVGGRREGEGPLAGRFDQINTDAYWGAKSFEMAESAMQKIVLDVALNKSKKTAENVDFLFAGDLLGQSIGATFGHRDSGIPFFGVFGACSTMGEALCLGAMAIAGGFGQIVAAVTSSHFCTAERQFRTPLDYGAQRTPTSQTTVTAAGATILAADGQANDPVITHITPGKIVDFGITDPCNMGAAMAPAAVDTIEQHLADTGRSADEYDLILTGDLGHVGAQAVLDLFKQQGVTLSNYRDCGLMVYDRKTQDVEAGGSGCGCAAAVLNGYLLDEMRRGVYKKVLFCPTGALLSPISTGQGQSIPGICHAVAIERAINN